MQGLESIKKLGRGGDTELAHLRPGELVVPPEVLEKYKGLRESLEKKLKREGFEYSSLVVGDEDVIINPRTGLPEFGLFSRLKKSVGKLWKKVKKVVDPVARVAQFIPGPLQPFAAVYTKGKSAINLAQGKGGLGDLVNIFTGPRFGDALGNLGKGFSESREFFTKGSDGIGFFENLGKIGGNIKEYVTKGEDGIGFFGNLQDSASRFFTPQEYVGPNPEGEGTITYSKAMYDALPPEQQAQFSAIPSKASGIFQNLQEGLGNLFSGQGSTQTGGLGGFLGNFFNTQTGGIDPRFAALATALGAATKKAAEKERGGLQDIRVNLRPDLQQQAFSRGFDLGLVPVNRPNSFAQGGQVIGESDYAEGGKVLDMRAGGESIGPGTGTSDDIPAMLSDGEFVMTAKANMGAGSLKLNKKKGGIMELVPSLEPDRKRGANNMMKLMRYFEGVA